MKARERSGSGEISASRAREIIDEFRPETPTAITYHPAFNDGVLILGQGVPPTPCSEFYCLRIPSALDLMVILADLEPVGYLDPPQIFATGSTFEYSQEVPWLRFANGAVRNAAQLAYNWVSNNGDPGGHAAEANARMDIAWG